MGSAEALELLFYLEEKTWDKGLNEARVKNSKHRQALVQAHPKSEGFTAYCVSITEEHGLICPETS